MNNSAYLWLMLIITICINHVVLQPEKVRWESGNADDDTRNQSFPPKSHLMKTILISSKRQMLSSSYEGASRQPGNHVTKKGLGMFRHGRPSLLYKSFFSPARSLSGFGLTRYGFDRPRPLRWG